MDRLRAMQAFAEVAERESFAAAARALDLAPPIVTRLVAELERQLGARLLVRTTRRVALTSIGQRYLQQVRGILRDIDDATALASQGQRDLHGRVRLSAPPLFAARQLMPRLARLQLQHPGISIELSASGPVESVDETQDISVVVRASGLEGDFVAHRLAQSQVLLCAAPDYRRRRGLPLHPAELAQHELLIVALAQIPRSFVLTHAEGSTSGLTPHDVRFRSSNAELCRAGALAGMGIAALPSYAVQAELAQGLLEHVLGDWRLFALSVDACLPRQRQLPAVVRATLDFLRAEFPGGTCDPWLTAQAPFTVAAQAALRLAA